MKTVSDLSVTSAPMRARHGWHPGWLFRGGAKGAWFDPSDLATLFQDIAGTIPVTTAGDPVGRMQDKSGNGHHAAQATSSARPIYRNGGGRHWLEFNGVNQFLVTPTITPGTDKVQVFSGVRKGSDAAAGIILEYSSSSSINIGSLGLLGPSAPTTDKFDFRSRGTAFRNGTATGAQFAAPVTAVVAGLGDISGDLAKLRVAGVQVAQNTGDQGTGNFLAYPAYIGMRNGASQPFTGNIYSLVLRFGPNLTDAEITSAERYVAAKAGVAL